MYGAGIEFDHQRIPQRHDVNIAEVLHSISDKIETIRWVTELSCEQRPTQRQCPAGVVQENAPVL
jgi:hypothetical protein